MSRCNGLLGVAKAGVKKPNGTCTLGIRISTSEALLIAHVFLGVGNKLPRVIYHPSRDGLRIEIKFYDVLWKYLASGTC